MGSPCSKSAAEESPIGLSTMRRDEPSSATVPQQKDDGQSPAALQMNQLVQSNTVLVQSNGRLLDRLESAQADHAAVALELARVRQEIAEAKQKQTANSTHLDASQADLTDAKSKLSDTLSRLDDRTAAYDTLTLRFTESESRLHSLQQSHKQLQGEHSALQVQHGAMESILRSSRRDHQASLESAAELRAQSLESKATTQAVSFATNKREIAEMQQKYTNSQEALQSNQTQLADLDRRLAQSESDLADATERHQAEVAELRLTAESAESRMGGELRAALVERDAHAAAVATITNQLQEVQRAAEEKRATLEATVERLTATLATMEQRVADLAQIATAAQLTAELAQQQLQAECDRLRAEMSAVTADHEVSLRSSASARDQLDCMRSAMVTIQPLDLVSEAGVNMPVPRGRLFVNGQWMRQRHASGGIHSRTSSTFSDDSESEPNAFDGLSDEDESETTTTAAAAVPTLPRRESGLEQLANEPLLEIDEDGDIVGISSVASSAGGAVAAAAAAEKDDEEDAFAGIDDLEVDPAEEKAFRKEELARAARSRAATSAASRLARNNAKQGTLRPGLLRHMGRDEEVLLDDECVLVVAAAAKRNPTLQPVKTEVAHTAAAAAAAEQTSTPQQTLQLKQQTNEYDADALDGLSDDDVPFTVRRISENLPDDLDDMDDDEDGDVASVAFSISSTLSALPSKPKSTLSSRRVNGHQHGQLSQTLLDDEDALDGLDDELDAAEESDAQRPTTTWLAARSLNEFAATTWPAFDQIEAQRVELDSVDLSKVALLKQPVDREWLASILNERSATVKLTSTKFGLQSMHR